MAWLQLRLALMTALCVTMTRCQVLPYTYPEEPQPNTTSLYFGLLQSFGGTYNSSGSIPGVELALDRINSDKTLLAGYTLHYILRDSFCDHTIALESLHRLIFDDPVKVAIMGSGCSPATEPTAEIDHYYNLTHISCVSSSIALSNRTRYRTYFQMLPSEADIAVAVFGAIKHYGWKHIAIITQNENILTLTVDSLGSMLQDLNVTYSERRFESRTGVTILNENGDLFDPDARIFFIATFSSHARDIICLAHRRGYRYPSYMFLTYAWYPPQWWTRNSTNIECDPEDRLEVLKLTLAFLHFPFVRFGNLTASTDVQLTGGEYLKEFESREDIIEGAGFCYDATWTLAKALNTTLNELMDNDILNEEASLASGLTSTTKFSLENFTYTNNVIQQVMLQYLNDTDFTGVTGPVRFKEGIRDVEALRVLQIRNSTEGYDWIKVGTVQLSNGDFTYVYNESDETLWPDGVPYDGVPRKELVTIHPALTALVSVLVAVGLVLSVVCLVFNIVFRKKKLIRLSSPNLNYIICVGAIILYLDMILIVIPSTNKTVVSILCNLHPWFTSIGYSLCYGTILVKMFRVYYIYSNPSPQKKNAKLIKDEVLIFLVFCMVILDAIILLSYMVEAGVHGNLDARRVKNAENNEDVDGIQRITTEFYTLVCDSLGRRIFLGILYGYKSILQILSLFLAFATRRVKVKGLNDTKAVAGAVYVTSITITVLLVCTFTVVQYINIYAAIFCASFFIGTTTILALLYIPNMVSLYRDPEGLTVFKTTEPTGMTGNSADRTTIETLRRRIRELESIVSGNSPRPESAASSQHLVPPQSSKRHSTASDISFDMKEGKERKTIWDNDEHKNGKTTTL